AHIARCRIRPVVGHIHTAVRRDLFEEYAGPFILKQYFRSIDIFRPYLMKDQFSEFILPQCGYPGCLMSKPAQPDQRIRFSPGNVRFEPIRMPDKAFRFIDQRYHRFSNSNHFHHISPPMYPCVAEIFLAARVISAITDCFLSSILGFEPAQLMAATIFPWSPKTGAATQYTPRSFSSSSMA